MATPSTMLPLGTAAPDFRLPDFYVFDADRRLAYRGQFDDSRPSNDAPVTGAEVVGAVDALLDGKTVAETQRPSMGCNIKWKRGNAPDYFG